VNKFYLDEIEVGTRGWDERDKGGGCEIR